MQTIRLLVCLILLPCPNLLAQSGIRVPVDLKISKIAGDSIVPNCYTIAVGNDGQIFASGPGYVRSLFDDDGNGLIDRFTTFSDLPKSGAQGLTIDGQHVYVVGDSGVLKFTDIDGDHVADDKPELVLPIRVGGEHHAHAIRKGPDNWWYLIGGNHTDADHALINDPASPVKKPRAGAIWRISPDWKTRGVWCHGFRNAYDFDFLHDGQIVVYDSDGERDITLPWYRPTRVFEAAAGSDAGWFSRSWKQPDHFFDAMPVLAEFGRGSPTGVVAISDSALPPRMRPGVAVLDWTFGRVISVNTDNGKSEVIAMPTGTAGFAVTDADIDSDGTLLVSVGGRGTSGGIYRIEMKPTERETPKNRDTSFAKPSRLSLPDALKTLETGNATNEQLARAMTTLGLTQRYQSKSLPANWSHTLPDLLSHEEPSVRRLAGWLGSDLASDEWQQILNKCKALGQLSLWLGMLESNPATELNNDAFQFATECLTNPEEATSVLLSAMRLATVAMGDHGESSSGDTRSSIDRASVFDGYRSRIAPKFAADLLTEITNTTTALVGSNDKQVSDEAIRLLAVLQSESPSAIEAVVKAMQSRNHPTDKLHCLIAIGRLRAQRSDEVTAAIASEMLQIPTAIENRGLHLERNFQARMREMYDALSYQDLLLEPAIVSETTFGEPEHLLWAEMFRPESTKMARAVYLKKYTGKEWPIQVANFVAVSYTPLSRRLIRDWLGAGETRNAGLLALAQHPRQSDFTLLAEAASGSSNRLRDEAIEAMLVIANNSDGGNLLTPSTAKSLWSVSLGDSKNKTVRKSKQLLSKLLSVKEAGIELQLIEKYGPLTADTSANSATDWKQRLASVTWSGGDQTNGEKLFKTSKCAVCHGGRKALGPNLAGVSKRFSRDDLMAAIYDPNRDVPDRFQARRIITEDGQVIIGMVIYESTDGLTLLDGDGETLRINKDMISVSAKSSVSLMPSGLIDDMTDQQIADLMAYIQTL